MIDIGRTQHLDYVVRSLPVCPLEWFVSDSPMAGKVYNDRYLAWGDSRIVLELSERTDDSRSCCLLIAKTNYIRLWDASIIEEIAIELLGIPNGTM